VSERPRRRLPLAAAGVLAILVLGAGGAAALWGQSADEVVAFHVDPRQEGVRDGSELPRPVDTETQKEAPRESAAPRPGGTSASVSPRSLGPLSAGARRRARQQLDQLARSFADRLARVTTELGSRPALSHADLLKRAELQLDCAKFRACQAALEVDDYITHRSGAPLPADLETQRLDYLQLSQVGQRDGVPVDLILIPRAEQHPEYADALRQRDAARDAGLAADVGGFNSLPLSERLERYRQDQDARRELDALERDRSRAGTARDQQERELRSRLIDPRFAIDPDTLLMGAAR